MAKPNSLGRFLLVVVMLASTALFLHARRRAEVVPEARPLDSFPRQIGSWTGTNLTIGPDVREVLGSGDFLSRLYTRSGGPVVDLFIAYFPSQRTGATIHSPKNCLPGSGWTPTESSQLQIAVPGSAPMTVNRYIVARGDQRQLVLYWYQAHGRKVASEYWAKFYLVADAIRMNRTDGSLVRMVTPIGADEDLEAAQARAVGFAQQVVPQLAGYIPN